MLALDDETQSKVALRLLNDRLASDPAFMEHYRMDTRALSRVEDPNLVSVYDLAEIPRGPVLVMDYVDGVSLRHVLDTQGPTGPLAALSVFGGILAGLAAAHQAGVFHGDLTPWNVLVDRSGVGKLTDFGLTALPGANPPATPAYLAPERWQGGRPDASGDVYAATALFFECLTGGAPYSAKRSADWARAHQGAPIPTEAVPGPLRVLAERGLAKDPADRPKSAADFLAELDEAAQAAYGTSWETQGRGRLAEMTVRAAATPAPAQSRTSGSWRTKGRGKPTAAVPQAAPVPAEAKTGQDPEEWQPYGASRQQTRQQAGYSWSADEARASSSATAAQSQAQTQAEPAADTAAAPTAAPTAATAPKAATATRTYADPPRAESPRTGEPAHGHRPRLLLGVAGVIAGIAGVAVAATLLTGGASSGDPSPGASSDPPQQSPPQQSAAANPSTDGPAAANALADRIERAVNAKSTAAFSYHGPGGVSGASDDIDATGLLHTGQKLPMYDMSVWNKGDRKFGKKQRTVVIGNNVFVTGVAPKPVSVPAARSAKSDLPHGYASMSATARWASAPETVLALLRSGGSLTETPDAYKGTTTLKALGADPAVGTFWAAYDDTQYSLSYTLVLSGDLPAKLTVRLDPSGGRPALVFKATYANWGRKADIKAP